MITMMNFRIFTKSPYIFKIFHVSTFSHHQNGHLDKISKIHIYGEIV